MAEVDEYVLYFTVRPKELLAHLGRLLVAAIWRLESEITEYP